MLKSPLLFAIGVLVSLINWTGIARASDDSLALSFALPPTSHEIAAQQRKPEREENISVANSVAKITATATPISPPSHTSSEVTDLNSTQPVAVSMNTVEDSMNTVEDSMNTVENVEVKKTLAEQNRPKDDIGLSFAETNLALPSPLSPDNTEATALAFEPGTVSYDSLGLDDWIFEGGPDSLVAHTVGSAEGTRQWNGKRTRAYYGHTDPGNGVWNLGTFSYQHGAHTPEEADQKQLRRLKNQGLQLEQQATNAGISLSLEEKLNGLDLANQAPLAALGKGGYVDRLDQAYRLQMTGFEAISWARTRAYIDPETQTWNAPGLGNNLHSISQDQERRMAAINKALRAYNRDDITVMALAKLDSISLESPAIESDELSRWDIHLTTTPSQPQKDGLHGNAPNNDRWSGMAADRHASETVESETVKSDSLESGLADSAIAAIAPTIESHRENTSASITQRREPEKAPTQSTASLMAPLSTLSFGLPPSETSNTASIEDANEQASLSKPQAAEPLESAPISLDRLLTSTNMTTAESNLGLQFATAEVITLPHEAEGLAQQELAHENLAHENLTDENLAHENLTDEELADSALNVPPNANPAHTIATSLITTAPSTALEQLARENAFSQPTTPSKQKVELDALERFEDPISLRPLATTSSHQTPHESVQTQEDPAQPIEESQANTPKNQKQWRIRIEDRVIDRK